MAPSPGIAAMAAGLLQIYNRLEDHFGNLRWWPADSPLEVIVGAILVQNTAWHNVTYAINKLKEAGVLTPQGLYLAPLDTLAELIRSSGYYNVKARRLTNFIHFLHDEYDNSLGNMFGEDCWQLRNKLLEIKGIGEESADSILLYAGKKPVFVIDAYTRRILARHGLLSGRERYQAIQALFMDHLPASVSFFNQYHALLVHTGKTFCRRDRRCAACPLKDLEVQAGVFHVKHFRVPDPDKRDPTSAAGI
ncbi:MAG: endonuclease III domain-containing protein [Syntrophales bacterium LBB04]|nr:endonuclease III domain-containing protein [Syntrophales bacterium LBB04]